MVSTVGNRCRACYSCIRSCPVKAIKVSDGQARIIPELCINCGVCLANCSQGAKQVKTFGPEVEKLLAGPGAVAVVDPFFPAAFYPARKEDFCGCLAELGFAAVVPLSGGTSLLEPAYARFLASHVGPVISSYCPAVVNLVEMYFPSLIEHLAPVPSLVVAGTILARRLHPGRKVVYLTPCLAARQEVGDADAPEAVLTFREIREMMVRREVPQAPAAAADVPRPDVFPAPAGIFAGGGMPGEDGKLVVEGRAECLQVLTLIARGRISPRFADLLFCPGGCLGGPEMDSGLDIYSSRFLMRLQEAGPAEHYDLPGRSFAERRVELPAADDLEVERVLRCTNKEKPEDELNCGACGYGTCREKAAAVCQGMAEVGMCLPYLLDQFRGEVEYYRRRSQLDDDLRRIIVGESPAIAGIRQLAVKMAQNDATLLIEGESGVGKEVFAQAVHQLSGRAGSAFIGINCAALPDQLLESELFGYEDGAFTGAHKGGKPGKLEMAGEGTVLLDEIGDLDSGLQAKLLRVLQERQFERVGGTKPRKLRARVMAATNRNLKKLAEEGRFRTDLYYRLCVITVRIPSLREHPEDIPLLVEHFLHKMARQMQTPPRFFAQKTLESLAQYHWPGNVRELGNVIEQMVYTREETIIEPGHLPGHITHAGVRAPAEFRPLARAVRQLEKDLIGQALQKTNNNRVEAARLLGVPRATFYLKLKEYGL